MKENAVIYITIVLSIPSFWKKQVRRSQNSLCKGGIRLTIKHKVVSSLQPRTSASVSNLAWVHCLSIHHVGYTLKSRLLTICTSMHFFTLFPLFQSVPRPSALCAITLQNLWIHVESFCLIQCSTT